MKIPSIKKSGKGEKKASKKIWSAVNNDKRLMAAVLAALSCINMVVSACYQPVDHKTIEIRTAPTLQPEAVDTAIATASDAAEAEPEQGSGWKPSLTEMNLFHVFSGNESQTDPKDSLGGQIFQELMKQDNDWAGSVYSYSGLTPAALTEKMGISKACIIGAYNPQDKRQVADDPSTWIIGSFRNVWFRTEDGDGNTISPYSNIPEIMSLANVYSYYHDPEDKEAFRSYCEDLWKASHHYTLAISDIYHCSGCVSVEKSADAEKEETQETEHAALQSDQESQSLVQDGVIWEPGIQIPEETREITEVEEQSSDLNPEESSMTREQNLEDQQEDVSDLEQTAEILEASSQEPETTRICPGHVDLTIVLKITGLTEQNNLFLLDQTGNDEKNYKEDGWQGWTEENRQAALQVAEKDWYLKYGLRTSAASVKLPVKTIDVDAYLENLPSDLSEKRKNLLRVALNSVGRIPYYWGGKPAVMGYDGNQFGSSISPDSSGRSLRGLDCSGWISWVYWTATGTKLPYESTTGLVNLGRRISAAELEPGDILVRTGSDAHTVMFLGWTKDGKIQCVHETSGSVNNVTISIRDADWPYYIRLVE